jgi:putative membrane protein
MHGTLQRRSNNRNGFRTYYYSSTMTPLSPPAMRIASLFLLFLLTWVDDGRVAAFSAMMPSNRLPFVVKEREALPLHAIKLKQHHDPHSFQGEKLPLLAPYHEKHEHDTTTTSSLSATQLASLMLTIGAATTFPETAAAADSVAGPVPSAVFAWLHFVGIMGVSGGLMTERFLIKYNMSEEEEIKVNNADGIYGLSAFSLLISGYFRVTQYAKGFDFYKNEPIFWLKMASVAVLGGLSFFPAIIFFRRDQVRRNGDTLPPLSDAIVDRITTILNAEILAVASIPFMASLMTRGVLYVNDFPWAVGVILYALSLGGAGYKYGKEAFDMMETENALLPLDKNEN